MFLHQTTTLPMSTASTLSTTMSITPDYDSETNAPRITPEEFMDIVFYDDEPDSDDEDFEDDKEKAQTLCDKFFQLKQAFDNRTVGESGYCFGSGAGFDFLL